MSGQFAVIGMGRLGSSLAETLDLLGHEVLGIDDSEDRIQDLSAEMPNVHLVAADATESSVLRDLGLEHFDGAAVVIGENMQANILVTLMLKELGVPLVISRAITHHHGRVLQKIGADQVIEPERLIGAQLARTMASPGFLDFIDLGEGEALAEIEVPKSWIGKTLAELRIYRKSGLTVVALKGRGQKGTIPKGDTVLREGDVMVVGGPQKQLDRAELFRG